MKNKVIEFLFGERAQVRSNIIFGTFFLFIGIASAVAIIYVENYICLIGSIVLIVLGMSLIFDR